LTFGLMLRSFRVLLNYPWIIVVSLNCGPVVLGVVKSVALAEGSNRRWELTNHSQLRSIIDQKSPFVKSFVVYSLRSQTFSVVYSLRSQTYYPRIIHRSIRQGRVDTCPHAGVDRPGSGVGAAQRGCLKMRQIGVVSDRAAGSLGVVSDRAAGSLGVCGVSVAKSEVSDCHKGSLGKWLSGLN
jgi:hypothetical protein